MVLNDRPSLEVEKNPVVPLFLQSVQRNCYTRQSVGFYFSYSFFPLLPLILISRELVWSIARYFSFLFLMFDWPEELQAACRMEATETGAAATLFLIFLPPPAAVDLSVAADL